MTDKNCSNCKYQVLSGQMMHPCFLCLNQQNELGMPLPPFSFWVDETLSWEEIEMMEEESQRKFDEWVENDPEIKAQFDKLVEYLRNKHENAS